MIGFPNSTRQCIHQPAETFIAVLWQAKSAGYFQINNTKAEIMFLDLNMPEMDGYEVLRAIREMDLPTMVIVVSCDIQPEAYQRVVKLGALAFIKKPVESGQIEELLKKYGIPIARKAEATQ